eukprot:13216-Rhodomonas_salina.1
MRPFSATITCSPPVLPGRSPPSPPSNQVRPHWVSCEVWWVPKRSQTSLQPTITCVERLTWDLPRLLPRHPAMAEQVLLSAVRDMENIASDGPPSSRSRFGGGSLLPATRKIGSEQDFDVRTGRVRLSGASQV